MRYWLVAAFLHAPLALVQGCDNGSSAGDSSSRGPAGSPEEIARSAPESEFSYVTAVAVDSRGVIYVGDWGSQSVVALEPSGKEIRRIGRKGNGPGEFQLVSSLGAIEPDSLLVYDGQLRRVTVFSTDSGKPGRSLLLEGGVGSHPAVVTPIGVGGQLLVLYRPVNVAAGESPDSLRKVEVRVVSPREGDRGKTLLSLPADEALVARTSGAVAVRSHPFGARTLVAVYDTVVYVARSDVPVIQRITYGGIQLASFNVPTGRSKITPQEAKDTVASLKEVFQAPLESWLASHDTWPALSGIIADDAGNLWCGVTVSSQRNRWIALDGEGREVGSLGLPSSDRLMVVREGLGYVVRIGANDVPSIVVLRVSTQRNGGQ